MHLTESDWLEVIQVVKRAGDEILAVSERASIETWTKSDWSPVTEADFLANRVILEFLQRKYAHFPAVSEEGDRADVEASCWLVDPLDGTKEFLSGYPEYTVNVALISNGLPTGGVVYAPALELLAASWDIGHLHVEGDPSSIGVSKCDLLRVATSRSHANGLTESFCKRLGTLQEIPMGSSLKILALALETCDLYPRFGTTMEWDTAAAHAILINQGGDLILRDGKSLTYGKEALRNPHFLGYSASNVNNVPFALESWRLSDRD